MAQQRATAQTLRRILQQQQLVGKQLVVLAEEETDSIVRGDIRRLTELQSELKAQLEIQGALDSQRQNAARELAWSLGLDRNPSLRELMELLPPRDRDPLLKLRLEMLEISEKLQVIDRRNRELLHGAMDFVRFSLDALTHAALQPPRYGIHAAVSTPAFYVDSKA